MNRYRVTAGPMKEPLYFQAASEDEAWEKAKKLADRNGMTLYNGLVEKVPTEKEKDAELARLRQRAATLADALETAKNQLEAVRKAGFKAASVAIAQHKAEAALAAYKESK